MSPEALLNKAIMLARAVPHRPRRENRTIPIIELMPNVIPIKVYTEADTRRQKIVRISKEWEARRGRPKIMHIAKEWAARHNSEKPQLFCDIPLIKRAVASYFGISVSDIEAHRRDAKSVVPRHITIYLCRQLTKYSSPKIAQYFENRDHTTIMNACNKAEELYKTDWKIRAQIEDIKLLITGMVG